MKIPKKWQIPLKISEVTVASKVSEVSKLKAIRGVSEVSNLSQVERVVSELNIGDS